MKKTLIALSVLAMAGSVNAATVYDADGVTATVFGDLEAGYKQAIGVNQDGALFVGDYDFGFSTTTAVNDDVSVFGTLQWNGNETSDDTTAGTNSPLIDNAYVGVAAGDVTVTVGRAVNFVDEIGVANDYQIAGNYEANDATGIDAKTSQVAKVMWDNGEMFYAGLAYTADADGDDTTNDDYEQVDLKAGLRVADLDVMVIYSDAEAGTVDYSNIAVEAHYDIDALSIGALYTTGEKETAGVKDEEGDAISLSVAYTIDKTTIGAGWSTYSDDIAGEKDQDAWYANVGYALATNATVYAEIAENEGDAGTYANNDMGYAVGLQLSF